MLFTHQNFFLKSKSLPRNPEKNLSESKMEQKLISFDKKPSQMREMLRSYASFGGKRFCPWSATENWFFRMNWSDLEDLKTKIIFENCEISIFAAPVTNYWLSNRCCQWKWIYILQLVKIKFRLIVLKLVFWEECEYFSFQIAIFFKNQKELPILAITPDFIPLA